MAINVYVYVPDVDAVHARALARGARQLAAVEDQPYKERQQGYTGYEVKQDAQAHGITLQVIKRIEAKRESSTILTILRSTHRE